MKNKKGFAKIPIILIIVVILAIGGVVYYISKQKISNSKSQLSAIVSKAVIPTPTPVATKPTACDPTGTAQPWIKVTSPNGGETYTAGQQVTVTWTSCNILNTESVRIDLVIAPFPPAGINGVGIVNTINDGSEVITLPNSTIFNGNPMTFGNNFKINIWRSVYSGITAPQDLSDNTFIINAPVTANTSVTPKAVTPTSTPTSNIITTSTTAATTATTTTSTSLKIGSSGNDVKFLQQALQSLGFLPATATIDGAYGSMTEAAVIAYQTSVDLTADGIAGTQTIKQILNKSVGPTPSPIETYIYLTSWGTITSGSYGIALDPSLNATMPKVYVVEGSNHTIKKFTTTDGISYSQSGAIGSFGYSDGQFYNPRGVAIDPSTGNVYVADTYNNRIQKFNSSGTFLGWFGKDNTGNVGMHAPNSGLTGVAGTTDGTFNQPGSIAVALGNVYVADTLNNRIQKFDLNGNYISQFNVTIPTSITVDTLENIYVVSYANHSIQKFTATGSLISTWGTPGVSSSTIGQFNNPSGIIIDSSNYVYVVERGNNRIQKFNSSGTFINKLDTWTGSTGSFYNPYGIVVDELENIYVLDSGHNLIQKFQSGGTTTTPIPPTQQKTSTVSSSVFTKTLEIGSTGGEIKVLQQALQFLGFLPSTATIDGVYGSTTQSAIKYFQASVGITADGIVGPLTLKKVFGL
ncbi:MAG: peptidoglycan-binding protein [Patescibacteria group bacterium]